jgi:predicted phosphodiesterase
MRVAVVSDIHGNLSALEAILDDLARQQPDLVLHGGDLAANGSRPAEVIDRVRELGWPGVAGNWVLAETYGDLGAELAECPP